MGYSETSTFKVAMRRIRKLMPTPTRSDLFGTIRESCLDRLILFGEDSLRKSIQEFTAHYHFERHHQGLGNRLIMPDLAHAGSTGEIRRRERLGGMLNYYYRDAA